MPAATHIYHNGTILTMDSRASTASCLAVRCDRIAAVGGPDDVAPLRGPDTRLVDLKGRTMLPGFYDCHSHYMRAGMYNALYLDAFAAPIGSLKTLAELAGRIRAGAVETPKGEWLLCAGYDDTAVAEERHFTLAELDAMDGVSVTHHELNRGKGCALKTGYAYIQAHFPAASGVITADADGQHTVEDCWHLAEVLTEGKRALYLGSRNFNLDHVPPKSRHGNKITSAVFRLLYGVYLPDTQTGLRAFRMADLPFMLDVPGERFEYEMQVLIACARAKLPMIPIEIETVYENENAGTHFHPIRDSYRIYKVILGNFFLYAGSSIICFLVDNGVANLLRFALLPLLGLRGDTAIQVSGYLARLVSSPLNFVLNRNFVFKFKQDTGKTALKYALLCIVTITLSNLGVSLLDHLHIFIGGFAFIPKILMDTLLYLVNYRIQNKWIFAKSAENQEG